MQFDEKSAIFNAAATVAKAHDEQVAEAAGDYATTLNIRGAVPTRTRVVKTDAGYAVTLHYPLPVSTAMRRTLTDALLAEFSKVGVRSSVAVTIDGQRK